MSCTNQSTEGPRHLLQSVVLCLASTSAQQASDTCYLLLFYVLHQQVHHRPQTPVTFFCFMSCTNQSTTGPRHLLQSVVLCLAPTSPPQAPDTCYLLLFYVLHQPVLHRPQTPVTFCCFNILLPRPFTTRKEKENRPSVRCLWRAKCILITEFRSCVNIQSSGAV